MLKSDSALFLDSVCLIHGPITTEMTSPSFSLKTRLYLLHTKYSTLRFYTPPTWGIAFQGTALIVYPTAAILWQHHSTNVCRKGKKLVYTIKHHHTINNKGNPKEEGLHNPCTHINQLLTRDNLRKKTYTNTIDI